MREIKFRAWDKITGIMTSPEEVGITPIASFVYLDDIFKKDNYIFQQFTGLKDKNCKDIYDGDIVKDAWSNIIDIWEVYFDNENARFWVKNRQDILGENNCEDDPSYPNWRNYEVIGNIYEHPELLKK